jgi:hypothetical protein
VPASLQSNGTFVPGVSSQGNGYQAPLHSGIPGGSFLHQFGGMQNLFDCKSLRNRKGNFYNTNNGTNRNKTVKFSQFFI